MLAKTKNKAEMGERRLFRLLLVSALSSSDLIYTFHLFGFVFIWRSAWGGNQSRQYGVVGVLVYWSFLGTYGVE